MSILIICEFSVGGAAYAKRNSISQQVPIIIYFLLKNFISYKIHGKMQIQIQKIQFKQLYV